ncbi:hypothetical protein Tco_1290239 [Tanacetum coccineum]
MEEQERGHKMANNDSTMNNRRRNLNHLQNMNKDKGGLQEGKFEQHRTNTDLVWNRVGNKKQEYMRKQPEVNKEKTANKYSILESLPDDDHVEIRILKDRMIGKERNKETEACNNEDEEDDIVEEVNELRGNVIANEINGKDNSILHQ